MSHKKGNRPNYTTRERVPILSRDGQGNALLLCPFCTPAHPINPESASTCGTILQVRALQTIYKAKKYGNEVCVKCGKGGGEMVMFQGALLHTNDCMPGVVALSTPPKFSKLAKALFGLRDGWIKKNLEGIFGEAVPVEEVLPSGERTGVIFGYFFKPRYKRGLNGINSQGKPT